MTEQGKFKKELNTTDLTFVALGAIFGSGWLFGASYVAQYAGPAGIISWVIGGITVFFLGLVYCELGAALPKAGGIIRFPVFSHGELVGYLLASLTVIAFSSLIAIEVVAARQYAAAWLPWLTADATGTPTMAGWIAQLLLTVLFFVINYKGVKSFAIANNIISLFKFIVPALVMIVLMYYFQPENLTAHGFAPFGSHGVQMAVTAGGVIFAYLGLTPVVSVASEVKNPQRTIPIALLLSIVLSTVIYIVLQLVFLGSIPPDMLADGWGSIAAKFSLPYHDIALLLGLGWLGILVVADAVISPAGTGNIYMVATPRVIYAWSRSGTFFNRFSAVDKKSGIPRPALWLTLGLSIFWTMPFPSWKELINVVSGALCLSYALAPIACGALRINAPDLPRPFRVRGLKIISPLTFIIASLIVYWSGWSVICWLYPIEIVLFFCYILAGKKVPSEHVSLQQQIRSALWLVGYYVLTLIISYLGSFGGKGVLTSPWDVTAMAVVSLVCYYWAMKTCLPTANITEAPDAD